MRAFQLGMVIMVGNGHIPSWMEEDRLEELLMETGKDLVQIQNVKREEREQ